MNYINVQICFQIYPTVQLMMRFLDFAENQRQYLITAEMFSLKLSLHAFKFKVLM